MELLSLTLKCYCKLDKVGSTMLILLGFEEMLSVVIDGEGEEKEEKMKATATVWGRAPAQKEVNPSGLIAAAATTKR